MYILAKLVFKNYVPLKLEQGMLFIMCCKNRALLGEAEPYIKIVIVGLLII